MELNKIFNEDCLIGMNRIPDKSVDMILCDLPYGTTELKWDIVIPFAPLWQHYERIIKDNGAILLTGKQPFTSEIVKSNVRLFRYEMVWEKSVSVNFMHAKAQPLQRHENILVFYKQRPVYNPQMEKGKPYTDNARGRTSKVVSRVSKIKLPIENIGTRFPGSVIKIGNPNSANIHPTQKPVPLFSRLIRTYTNPGDLVLDSCMGSGTTAISCIQEGRNYIGFEMNEKFYNDSLERIEIELATPEQLKLIV